MNCSSLGSSFQGTLQSGILNRVAISFSRVFSQARDLTQVSCIAGRFFTLCATWEACIYIYIYSCCSVAQLCLPLWDTTDCSTPGSPAHHHLLELAWTHVHWVSDAIQPSPPLSSPSPVLMFASWLHTGFSEAGKVVWHSHLFKNYPQFVVIHTVKGFSVVNEAERDVFFWNYLHFSMIQWMLAIWYLIPLLFLNSAWTSESYRFMYCSNLAWRILSTTLLACEMSSIVW